MNKYIYVIICICIYIYIYIYYIIYYIISCIIYILYNTFSGGPPKSLGWQGDDNFSWLPGFVKIVAMVVRGNRARNQQSSPVIKRTTHNF